MRWAWLIICKRNKEYTEDLLPYISAEKRKRASSEEQKKKRQLNTSFSSFMKERLRGMRKKLTIITVFLFGLIIGLFLIPEVFRAFDIEFFKIFD